MEIHKRNVVIKSAVFVDSAFTLLKIMSEEKGKS